MVTRLTIIGCLFISLLGLYFLQNNQILDAQTLDSDSSGNLNSFTENILFANTYKTNSPPKAIFGQMPLYFVENRGQLDNHVAYYIQGEDKTLYFTPKGVTFALAGRSAFSERQLNQDNAQRWSVKLDFVDANPDVQPIGQEQAKATISYFKNTPDQWQTGLATYTKLVYPNLWPGIDLVFYGTVNKLKYEFIIKPGADPNQIRLAYRGVTSVNLNAAGQLEVFTPFGSFFDDTPIAYQDIEQARIL